MMASALIIKSPEKSIMKSNVGFVKMMTEEDATHDSGGILRGLLSRAGECDRHTRNKYLWKQAVTSIQLEMERWMEIKRVCPALPPQSMSMQ